MRPLEGSRTGEDGALACAPRLKLERGQAEGRIVDFLKKIPSILGSRDEVQLAPPIALAGRYAGKGPDPSSLAANRRDPHVNLTKENEWSSIFK